MRNRSLAIALLAAASIAGGAASTGAATQTVVPRDCVHEAVRPHQIIITCADANFVLTGLRWSHWGRRTATGTGSAKINDCKPFCAKGHFHKYPVSVRLSSAHFCRSAGKTQFRRMRLTFTHKVPAGNKRTNSPKIACPPK
jgi:hypothetical protein